MKIGDKLMRIPVVSILDRDKHPKLLPCRVVYIHPQRRFYSVQFDFPGQWEHSRSFRESYFFPDRLGDMYPTEMRLKYEKDCDYEQQGGRRENRNGAKPR